MDEYEDFPLRSLRLEEAKLRAERANYEAIRARQTLRPSHMVYTVVKLVGGKWVCIHPSSEIESQCPQAYGSTPEQAMINFDALWLGGPELDLDPNDPENQSDSELEDL